MKNLHSNRQEKKGAISNWIFGIAYNYAQDDFQTPQPMKTSGKQNVHEHGLVPVAVVSAFSTNEFARLVVVIRDYEQGRAAITNAGSLELSRAHLDAVIYRDSFWNAIKQSCNSVGVMTKANYSADVDKIDAIQFPNAHISVSTLQKHLPRSEKRFHVLLRETVCVRTKRSTAVPGLSSKTKKCSYKPINKSINFIQNVQMWDSK